MSKHRSYGKRGKGGVKRSVLTRYERIAILKELRRFDPKGAKKVTGLPKTKALLSL